MQSISHADKRRMCLSQVTMQSSTMCTSLMDLKISSLIRI